MRSAALLATSCLLATLSPLHPPPAAATEIGLDRLTTRPRVLEVELSPDGERLAYRLREDVGSSLWLREVPSEVTRRLLQSELIESIDWTSDSRGLFLVADERIAHLDLQELDARPRWIASLDAERHATLLGVDPSRPQHLLLVERSDDGDWTVVRVDRDGARETLWTDPMPVTAILLDRAGRPAVVQKRDHVALEIVLVDAEGREILRCANFDPCRPLSVEHSADDPATLHLLARLDGDRARLRSLRLDGSFLDAAMEAVPGADSGAEPGAEPDLDSAHVDPESGRPLLAVREAAGHEVTALAPELAGPLRDLRARLGHGSFEIQPRRGRWLVTERGPFLHHPRHHLLDLESGRLRPLLEAERRAGAPVPGELLAVPRFVTYRADDGHLVNGWLALPPRVDDAARLGLEIPLVVQVHGGPWNHIHPGFSPLVQRLASRGVAVFAPNFRGSTGFGRDYVLAGGDFTIDGRVQADILDGVERLLGRTVGALRDADRLPAPTGTAIDDPRLAILGHSFGGYSTLAALAAHPTLFRAGVATAPPLDLVRTISRLDERDPGLDFPLHRTVRQLLDIDDPTLRQSLRAGSPEAHLHAIESPLLLMAGGVDDRVDVADVRAAALALDARGHDVNLVVDEAMGHSFDTERRARVYLELVDRFLATHLELPAVESSAAPSPADDWRRGLDAHIEIAGPSLERILSPR